MLLCLASSFCSPSTGSPPYSNGVLAERPTPLILAPEEGERRIRRTLGGAPLIIKVDRRNGGAPTS